MDARFDPFPCRLAVIYIAFESKNSITEFTTKALVREREIHTIYVYIYIYIVLLSFEFCHKIGQEWCHCRSLGIQAAKRTASEP